MPTLHIPLERCLRIQEKLRDILQTHADRDLNQLLDDIKTACITVSAETEPNRPQRIKRTAPDGADTADASKKIRNTDIRNTRNDGRKRSTYSKTRDAHTHEVELEFQSSAKRHTDINAGNSGTAANCYGWDDDSDLSSLPSDSDEEETSMGDTAEHQKPRRRIPKTKGQKQQSWEVVDDVRIITEDASALLQLIAGIGDQTNTKRLLALKDMLSGQSQEPDDPNTMSLEVLVNRCEQSELMVAESKFKHMVNLMQLSLWLDQCVYSSYVKCMY
jgi:hypothetical protein